MDGFCTVEEFGVPPGKDQFQEVGVPVAASVKFTVAPALTVVLLAVKFAIGRAALLLMVPTTSMGRP